MSNKHICMKGMMKINILKTHKVIKDSVMSCAKYNNHNYLNNYSKTDILLKITI